MGMKLKPVSGDGRPTETDGAFPEPAVQPIEETVPQASTVAQASTPAPAEADNAGEAACATSCATSFNRTRKGSGETPALLSGWHSRGYLPHMKAEGQTYFVTFRLADTLPKDILEVYRFERDDIVERAKAMGRDLTPDEKKRTAELHSERIESYLDSGRGDCWLNIPEIADMVAKALRHFDGERYRLHAWVVMPNHVHAVLTPIAGHNLSNILHNWKSFTAHEAKITAQASRLPYADGGAFWQRESYDHLVRDETEFARFCEYTIQNPVKAGLCERWEDWPYVGVAQDG